MGIQQCNEKKEHISMKMHSGQNTTGTPTPDRLISQCR